MAWNLLYIDFMCIYTFNGKRGLKLNQAQLNEKVQKTPESKISMDTVYKIISLLNGGILLRAALIAQIIQEVSPNSDR